MDATNNTLREFRRSLRSLERQIERSLAEQTECCGVSSAQCHILLSVEDGEEASVGDLANRLELDASTLSRTVDKLVRAGLLKRRTDPESRRRQLVSLSASGRSAVNQINSRCDSFYKGLLATLPEADVKALLRTLPRLAEAMAKARMDGLGAASTCCRSGGVRSKKVCAL